MWPLSRDALYVTIAGHQVALRRQAEEFRLAQLARRQPYRLSLGQRFTGWRVRAS
jgi:hypothetical protein